MLILLRICSGVEHNISMNPIFSDAIWEKVCLMWGIPIEFRERLKENLPFSTTFENNPVGAKDPMYGKCLPPNLFYRKIEGERGYVTDSSC